MWLSEKIMKVEMYEATSPLRKRHINLHSEACELNVGGGYRHLKERARESLVDSSPIERWVKWRWSPTSP